VSPYQPVDLKRSWAFLCGRSSAEPKKSPVSAGLETNAAWVAVCLLAEEHRPFQVFDLIRRGRRVVAENRPCST
jgi:hypothetical protein